MSHLLNNKNYTEVLVGKEGRDKVVAGAMKLKKIVETTMGARGRYSVYLNAGAITNLDINNDGVTTIRNVKLQDKFEEIGAKTVREASERTNSLCGDYTTGTAVLAANLIAKGAELIDNEIYNPVILKEELDNIKNEIIESLKKLARPIPKGKKARYKTFENIATISAKDKRIGEVVAKAYDCVGDNGALEVHYSLKHNEINFEKKNGYTFAHETIQELILDRQKQETSLNNCDLILIDEPVEESFPDKFFAGLFQELSARDKNGAPKTGEPQIKDKLVIVAQNWTYSAMNAILRNTALYKENYPLIILVSAYGKNILEKRETIQDLSAITGIKPFTADNGFSNNAEVQFIKGDNVGTLESFLLNPTECRFIVKEQRKEVMERIKYLENELEKSKRSGAENINIANSLTKLNSGSGIIYVNAATTSEFNEKSSRIEDAIRAVKSANKFGIVAGAGAALREVSFQIGEPIYEDNSPCLKMVKGILFETEQIIQRNAGIFIHEDDELILVYNKGYDCVSREIVNLFEHNITDPAYSIIEGVNNAFAAAGTLLLSEVFIVEVNE